MQGEVFEKLTVLGEGAKYDVSCSSSGADRSGMGSIGNTACAGICHSWSADGRCISLLKVLLSNDCSYDCKYCVNRRSADTKRCTFEPKELADLTMEFYRRNYIEGLFLSSAVLRTADNTAERMYEVLYLLREIYGFNGYIHTKIIPGTDPAIIQQLGLVTDRLSVNVELPSRESLSLLAPQKQPLAIFSPMKQILHTQIEQKTLKSPGTMKIIRPAGLDAMLGDGSMMNSVDENGQIITTPSRVYNPLTIDRRRKYKERFAPAGQTTQMIIGASPESDRDIIHTSEKLYHSFSLKRVYFSAYIPVTTDPNLPSPLTPPNLKREHRLYQADWLLRFYGFKADEILSADEPNLDYDFDPKMIWAFRNIQLFPIEVNTASFEELLRIPGVGNVSAKRIVRQRKIAKVSYEDLKKMRVVLKRARFFLTCDGKYYGESSMDPESIRNELRNMDNGAQISMFEALVQKGNSNGLSI